MLDTVDPALASAHGRAPTTFTPRGRTAPDEVLTVAAAAARAGLQFVIFTDHGDGHGRRMRREYLDGVLCLDGVEISTNGGHYVALDMKPAPYPARRGAVRRRRRRRRLGGFGIAAHPDHPRRELAWNDWYAPIDGIEWINADVEWRDEHPVGWRALFFDYLAAPGAGARFGVRPAGRDAGAMGRRSRSAGRSSVWRQSTLTAAGAEPASRATPAFGIGPRYEASFRSLSNRTVLSSVR